MGRSVRQGNREVLKEATIQSVISASFEEQTVNGDGRSTTVVPRRSEKRTRGAAVREGCLRRGLTTGEDSNNARCGRASRVDSGQGLPCCAAIKAVSGLCPMDLSAT